MRAGGAMRAARLRPSPDAQAPDAPSGSPVAPSPGALSSGAPSTIAPLSDARRQSYHHQPVPQRDKNDQISMRERGLWVGCGGRARPGGTVPHLEGHGGARL
jgi:hypothetical protein